MVATKTLIQRYNGTKGRNKYLCTNIRSICNYNIIPN